MIILASPTKQMNFDTPLASGAASVFRKFGSLPRFGDEAAYLLDRLGEYDSPGLEKLMKISPDLASRTAAEILAASRGTAPRRPALFAYSGTVYSSMAPENLDVRDIRWAQKHLRILSGLYGILRPLDTINPYRLEMQCPLPLEGARSLAAWWKGRIRDEIPGNRPVINLASAEYTKALDLKLLSDRMVTFSFKEQKGGQGKALRTVGMYAKTARGVMLRRILQEKPDDPSALQSGNTGGYFFSPEHSSSRDWVFVRQLRFPPGPVSGSPLSDQRYRRVAVRQDNHVPDARH